MGRKEQVTPLAPAADRISSDEDYSLAQSKHLRRRKCLKCFGCCMAFMVIQAVVIIVLVFTVFRVKDPKIKMNSVTLIRLDLINGTTTPRPGVNITLVADVSVKNDNAASFKYSNTTTTIYYRGAVIGEARNPPGKAKARRTQRINVTVDIIPDKLINDPNLQSDINSRMLTMNSYTRIGGRVNIMNILKKHVTVKMNCSMTVNLTSQNIQEQKCKRRVSI